MGWMVEVYLTEYDSLQRKTVAVWKPIRPTKGKPYVWQDKDKAARWISREQPEYYRLVETSEKSNINV